MNGKSILRFAVSAALIAYVLSRAEIGAVAEMITAADPVLVGVAFLSYFLGYVFSVARWGVLLQAHGSRPRFGYLYSSFMIGMFFNQILPTTVGGDVARYHYTSGVGRGAAFSSVFMDRVFGVVSLMMFALGGLVFAQRFGEVSQQIFEAVSILLALGLIAIAVVFLLTHEQLEKLKSMYRFLPGGLVNLGDKALGVFDAYRGRRDVVLKALLLSLLLQCVVVLHYYLVGRALGLPVPIYGYVYIVPVAIVIMMLPISINGIGVRESVFAILLGTYGVETSEAVAFSWIVYGLILVQGLIGGVVFASVRRNRMVA